MCCSHDALSRHIHTCNEWQTRYSEVFHLYAYMQTYCYVHEWYKLPKNCYHLGETFGRHFPANGIHGILLIGGGGEREWRKDMRKGREREEQGEGRRDKVEQERRGEGRFPAWWSLAHRLPAVRSGFICNKDGVRFQPWRSTNEYVMPSGLAELEQLHVELKSSTQHLYIAAPHTADDEKPGNEVRVWASGDIRACSARATTCEVQKWA